MSGTPADIIEVAASHDDVTYWALGDRVAIRYSGMEDTRGGDVKAQVEVRWNEAPDTGIVKHGWMALGGTAGSWANDLAKVRPELTAKQWGDIVYRSSYMAKRRYQTGEPFEFIGAATPKPTSYVLRPLIVDSGPTVLSAEGGSTKSFLALAAALSVAGNTAKLLGVRPTITGSVLYLDWEDERATQDARAWALCNAVGIPVPSERVVYQRMRSPLASGLDPLLRKIADLAERPVMVVIDSVGKARGGDVNSAQDTNALFAAIDKMGMPSVCIDHKSKEAISRKLKGPIGSVYSWNSARIAWDIEKAQAIGSDTIQIIARNVKSNGSRLHRPLAWQVDFTNEGNGDAERLVAARYRPIDPLQVQRLDFDQASLMERIEAVLATSDVPMPVRSIAEDLDSPLDTIRKTLNRHQDRFTNVALSGEGAWALVDRDRQATLDETVVF